MHDRQARSYKNLQKNKMRTQAANRFQSKLSALPLIHAFFECIDYKKIHSKILKIFI